MIQSMTGYAAAAAESPKGRLSLELRSVNSRFLDLQFRVADELRGLEPMLRERITSRVARGKVDCRLFLNEAGGVRAQQALDPAVLAQVKGLAELARRSFPDATPLRLADVLRWPGAIAQPQADDDALGAAIQALCDRALDELTGVRQREGEKLAAVVAARIADMRARLAAVAPLVPEAVAAYRRKLEERLKEAMGSGNDERIRAEMALFAAKVDIDEELERLRAHCSEVDRTLRKGGVAGKRLDFLAQELNREANTLASKAASGAIADCALELKLLVEQVREQVQNIE
jgi:uncharacterized protein (TIGR00255 family)